eukprot:13562279-Alexandrium_andersonii.AAC.1
MAEPPSAWDLAVPAPPAPPSASAPTMATVQVHPGGNFHLHQPGSMMSAAPAASVADPRVVRE